MQLRRFMQAVWKQFADGRQAQEQFIEIILQGLSEKERECIRQYFEHMQKNINSYLKEETE